MGHQWDPDELENQRIQREEAEREAKRQREAEEDRRAQERNND